MDALKKVLHPKSHTDDNTSSSSGIPPSAHTHPNAETRDAIGDQPNVTGTDRHPAHAPAQDSSGTIHHEPHEHEHEHKQPRAGHHHPRQPVGATGLPPNHKPRSDFTGGQAVGVTGADAGRAGGDVSKMGKVVAESGNNFPGTNPHPAHNALGNKDAQGAQGTLNPGRE